MAKLPARRAARMAALAVSGITVITAALLLAPPVRSESDLKIESVPGEFVVQLKPSANFDGFERQALSLGAEVVENIRGDLILVRAAGESSKASGIAAQKFAAQLSTLSMVEVAEPNYIYRAVKLPNDPDLQKLWGLKNSGAADTAGARGLAGIDVGAESAWEITTGSKSVIVAVIDTGIDFGHPDLKAQAWVNEKEKNGKAGVDDDSNGYVDDVNGFNFAGNKGDSTDDNGHGSHCAGTIGAKGDDGKGLVGVNWDVSMMAVKFLDKSGSGTLANAVKSIDYARINGAHIMSNSWGGGGPSEVLKKSIEDANAAGILFVAAAGNETNNNDANPTYPAGYEVENVLSVAAIDNRGALASFSNWGQKTVHVAAPGVNIVSTVPGAKYDSYSGTSMATPHVAGIAALLLAQNSSTTHLELKQRIIESARPLYNLKTRVSSGGIADAYYALSGLTPPADPNDPSRLPNNTPYKYSSDHPYKENTKTEHRITISGAKKLAVRFSQFETEPGYDTVSFFDGKGAFVGSLSGKQEPGITSPLIHGDTLVIKFSSDETVNAYGFDVESVLSE
ncbi:MAG: S8 family serine peptidase [Bdellovibrionales bacterium]|nr:S8 family serine peptidase [Bdellovibrionales bacterium]